VADWLTIGTNSQYSDQDLSGLAANFNQAFFLIPLINAYEEDGSIALYPWPEEPVFQNPLSNLNVLDEHYKRTLFSNNYLQIDFPFVPGLSYKLNTGFTFTDTNIGRYWGPTTVVGFENNGQSYTENSSVQDRLIENLLIYNKSWGKHNLNVTALYSTQSYSFEERTLTARDFPTNVLTWYQPNVAAVSEPNNSFLEQKYQSQMGRVNYNYNSRYLITLTARRDGYSAFGKDRKYGTFPSVAVGWNMGDEPFMSGLTWLDQLKVRGSIGQNGNQAVSPYLTLAGLGQSNYLMGPNGDQTAPGYAPDRLASPELGWETSTSWNAGIDMVMFNGRLQSSIDYYNTNTTDLLLFRRISPVHGIPNVTQNIGETKNEGLEFNITSINVAQDDFQWTTNFNFAYNRNEILDLYGNGQDDVASGWFIGKSIDANFGYVFDGVWQEGDDIDNSTQPNALPGDVKVRDVNGDGVIGPDDRDFMGHSNPRYTAGLTNTLSYKNFTLSFIFFTQQGATRVNPLWDTDLVWSDVRRNSINLNNWSESNPTNEYPANRDGTNPFELRFYQDASFVRLRDITLGYSFDNALSENIGLSQLRLYANVRNALTFTSWEGLDPELSEQRGIPIDRTFSLGLNFSF
jgi:TonB-linked SusC/RagA family outer membrane protein